MSQNVGQDGHCIDSSGAGDDHGKGSGKARATSHYDARGGPWRDD